MKYLVVILLLTLLSGCGGSNNSDSSVTELRIMNLITDSDIVGFELNEENFASVGYKGVSGFIDVAGNFQVDLELFDADGISTTLVDDRSITMDGNREYTFYAVGTTTTADFFAVPAENEETTADHAKLQFVNGTQENLTVFVYAPGELTSGVLHTETIAPRDFAIPVEIPTQAVQLQVHRDDGTVVFLSLTFTLQNEWDVVFVLTDYLGPGGPDFGIDVLGMEDSGVVFTVGRSGLPASIRYVDAMSGLPAITVTSTDLLQVSTAEDVSFGQSTGRADIDGGIYNVTATPADNVGAPVFNTTVSIIGGFEYTLMLAGDLALPESFLLVDDTRSVATHAKLQIAHTAQSLPEVDVYIAPFGGDIFSGNVFAGMPYRTSRDLSLADGLFNITVTSPSSQSILVGPFTVNTTTGSVDTVIIHESASGGAPFGISPL